jgi:D-alanyl-lipoteichoic acid acyltransferase DltB (MBOAT superfamily)
MILALPKFNLVSFAFLFGVCLLIFLVGYLLNGNILLKDKFKRVIISAGGIILVVLILSFFKYSWLQEVAFKYLIPKKVEATDYIFIIGISYSSFKMIHFLIDSYKKQIKHLNIFNFISYIFFFPAFISGPINRYNQFSEALDLRNTSNIKNDLKIGVERIIHGLFKKFVLSTIMFPYAIVNIQKSILELNPYEILLGCYAYTLYFYFDFWLYLLIYQKKRNIPKVGINCLKTNQYYSFQL